MNKVYVGLSMDDGLGDNFMYGWINAIVLHNDFWLDCHQCGGQRERVMMCS